MELVKINVRTGEIEQPKLTKPEKDWLEKADENDKIDLVILAKKMVESLSKDALEKNLPFKVKFEFLENHPLAEKVLKISDKYDLNIEKLTNEGLIKDYKQDIESLPIDYTTDGQKEVYKNLIENCKKSIDYLNEIKKDIPEEIFNSQVEMRQSCTEYFESRLQSIP